MNIISCQRCIEALGHIGPRTARCVNSSKLEKSPEKVLESFKFQELRVCLLFPACQLLVSEVESAFEMRASRSTVLSVFHSFCDMYA